MKQEINATPRMSINPLCEYVYIPSASRRSTIIKNAKEKLPFIVKRYNEAEDFLAHYLASRAHSKILIDQVRSLRTDYYSKEFNKECALLSAEALEAFYKNGLWLVEYLKEYNLEVAVNQHRHKTMISGVQISIRPELILLDKDNKQRVGFLKFYISKLKPLESQHGELITCLGKYYFLQEHTLDFKLRNCLVLDVFNGELISAPKAFKKRIFDITASCKEIADRWALIN